VSGAGRSASCWSGDYSKADADERQVTASPVVVRKVATKDTTKVLLVDHDDMIQTFSSRRTEPTSRST
jgi:translation initiation factor RLI1